MNSEQYVKYQAAVDHNLKGLSFVSTGYCKGCSSCAACGETEDDELGFSWSACESCGSTLGGNRYSAHGRDSNNAILHFEVCEDCLYFLNYGELDDGTMDQIA